jgi:hypothetical protein
MVYQIEVITQEPFISKVKNEPVKINQRDYEKSEQGIGLLIWRYRTKLKKTYDPIEIVKLESNIKRLRIIVKDIQDAIEILKPE